jgi:hypothetical protein
MREYVFNRWGGIALLVFGIVLVLIAFGFRP